MSRRIARFDNVSLSQFQEGFADFTADEAGTAAVYESIRLPRRATKGSAGYDFYTPVEIKLQPGESMKVPTGIRGRMEDDWV
ncbi:MAG: deoxyuridine 5'-triphosphate nucleotidohydrolase, partial [Lachnospiraceae bacterium]|nr:deoxyuridine 5'-triphosphate nucleotidohydrolase [Lachnospiraceae bacterium]